jgi:hypothetical protein
MKHLLPKVCLILASATSLTQAQTTTCSSMALGQGASLNGFVPFPATDAWRQNIESAAVDPNSATLLSALGSTGLHPDFGAGQYDGSTMGMPYVTVSGTRGVAVTYGAFDSESDPGPMPIPASAPIEGYPAPNGDRHVLVLDRDKCWLYELYNATVQGDGSWNADAGAVWDLLRNNNRPLTSTSADGAGLPIFPGLTRYDEVASGQINHALRFTVAATRAAFVAPATHWASSSTSAARMPMGTRLRLRAGYDITSFPPQAKVVLQALKTYGMILADNGSNMFISGTPDERWDDDDLHSLRGVPASAFEVMQMDTVYTAANLPTGTAPAITSFNAGTAEGASKAEVKLTWDTTGASYFIVSPHAGAVRGNSVKVHPTSTTTYTLFATNSFGSTSKTVTVTVP